MNVLLDSNILLRIVQKESPHHHLATAAVDQLVKSGHAPCLVPQNLYEFWAVASRPKSDNGIGFSTQKVDAEITRLEQLFILHPDSPAVMIEWRKLVLTHDCKGKPSHDARIAAAMMVHGVASLVTFNKVDFERFTSIRALHPQEIVDGKF